MNNEMIILPSSHLCFLFVFENQTNESG